MHSVRFPRTQQRDLVALTDQKWGHLRCSHNRGSVRSEETARMEDINLPAASPEGDHASLSDPNVVEDILKA